MKQTITAFAPATVANVASGFDVLGFALKQPGDTVKLIRREDDIVNVVCCTGDDGRLPLAPDKNTASVAVKAYLKTTGIKLGVDIEVHKGTPLNSGLGSSAASGAAAVYAINCLAGEPLTTTELLPFAMAGEKIACGSAHADNVAPSLLGGFVLIRSYDPLDVVRLPVPNGLSCVAIHPHVEVKTEDARRILKKEIQLADAIKQWGNLAALVSALYSGDLSLLGRSLQDVVAEPLRSPLIPGFDIVKEAALNADALGYSISGSGPTVFALCAKPSETNQVASAMKSAFASIELDSDVFISDVSPAGAQVVETERV